MFGTSRQHELVRAWKRYPPLSVSGRTILFLLESWSEDQSIGSSVGRGNLLRVGWGPSQIWRSQFRALPAGDGLLPRPTTLSTEGTGLRWLGPLFVVLTVVTMVYKVVLMGIIDTLPPDQMAKHVTIVI